MPRSGATQLCGYSRLSVDRDGDQEKAGYEVQQSSGERWAAHTGETIGRWYKDKNITAADRSVIRPRFEEMMADIAAGLWKGIVVWKIDRLTRLPGQFEDIIELLESVGGYIQTTDDNLDSRNPDNLMTMRFRVTMGDQEVKLVKRRVTANKRRSAQAGKYTGGGRRPFGFEPPIHDGKGRVTNSGSVGVKHVPHEVKLLQDAARRIAWESEGYQDVIRDWHSRKIYGVTGSPWTTKTLQTLLTSPRMIGMQAYEDEETGKQALVKAEWEPVLDEPTWKRLHSLKNPKVRPHNRIEKYLLTGIVLCGRCEKPLGGGQRTYARENKKLVATRCYRCPSGIEYKEKGNCGKLNALAEPVENLVISHVLARIQRTRGLESASRTQEQGRIFEEIDELNRRMAQGRDRLAELRNAWLKKQIDMDDWTDARKFVQVELNGLEAELRLLANRLDVPTPVASDFDDLIGWFERLTFRQRKAVIAGNVERVLLLPPGRSGRYFRPERVVVEFPEAKHVRIEGEEGGVGDLDGDALPGAGLVNSGLDVSEGFPEVHAGDAKR